MTDATSGRIKSLDGLRGLAVISVIAFHYINNQIQDDSWAIRNFGKLAVILQKTTYFGWAGVNLFFILSGFLIGNILLTNRHKPNYFKAFYIRRFCRIIPPYYLLLLIYIGIMYTPVYNPAAYIFDFHLPMGSYFLFLQNFYMAWNNNFGPQALTPTWSLCVEEQFYLIIPFLVLLIKPRYAWIMVPIGCLLAIYSRHLSTNFYEGYVLLPSRLDSPMIGFLLAWLHQKEGYKSWIKLHINWMYPVLLGFTIFCGAFYTFSDPGIYSHFLLAILFGIVMVIALYSDKSLFTRFLSMPWLIYVGKLSYFIYLFHMIVIGLMQLLLLKQLRPALDGYLSIWITLASLALTFVLAELSFRWFEGPIIKFSHKFTYSSAGKNRAGISTV